MKLCERDECSVKLRANNQSGFCSKRTPVTTERKAQMLEYYYAKHEKHKDRMREYRKNRIANGTWGAKLVNV